MSEGVSRDLEKLERLAELDLAAAERVHAKLMVAEEASEVAELGRTYQRLARCCRQTIALKAKLAKPEPAPARDPVRNRERRDALRTAGRRIIWSEHEPLERPETEEDDYVGEYFDLLDREIAKQAETPDFGSTDLDDHIVELCADLDLCLTRARNWRDLPPVPPHAHIDWDAAYRNSS